MANGRIYIGVSKDSKARFKQHRYNPPSRMREDVNTYQPFLSHFYYEILEVCTNKEGARIAEREHIQTHAATTAAGYNTLPGHPASSRQYWWLHRRGLLSHQRGNTT
jgi:hypothetical protein